MKNIVICLLAATASIMYLLVSPAFAYKPGSFPGSGSYSNWQQYALPLYQAAQNLRYNGKLDQAIAKINQAISVYPYDATFFQELGYEYQERDNPGDLDQAIEAYDQATRLNGDDWSTWRDLGHAMIKSGRSREALEALQKAIECKPPAKDAGALEAMIRELKVQGSDVQ